MKDMDTYSTPAIQARPRTVIGFLICLFLPLAIGGISGYITSSEIDIWFSALKKPSFYPPSIQFGVVWTVLYILMGISSFMVWKSTGSKLRTKALTVYGIQLFLNFWWIIIFFSFHLLLLAVIEIVMLWAMIIYMITLFGKINKVAAYVNIPYILWVSFATLLTISTWWLNN